MNAKNKSENPNNELSRVETLVSSARAIMTSLIPLLRETKELIDQQYEERRAKEKSKLI